MARVLLIQPPVSADEAFARGSKSSASVIPPLGLAYIAACLMRASHECRIIDGIADPMPLEAFSRVAEQFDVVGITVVSAYAVRAIELLRELKKLPACPPIVVGGPHVTALPDSLLRFGADYAVVGEGEATMLELVEVLAAAGDSAALRTVRGIGFLESGQYHFTGPRKRIEPLDTIPLPARDLLPMQRYRGSVARSSQQPSLSMLTSRGCPGVCTFCSKLTFGTQVRYFSVERIVEEFFLLRNHYKARDVCVWDDNFVANREVVLGTCEQLMQRGFDLTWSVESRIDGVDREVLSALKRAGCSFIAYGIESGSQRVLDHVHKRTTKERIRETVAVTKEVGIAIRGYFVLGFPTETAKEMEDTIRFATELDLEVASFTLLVPLPGTAEYVRAKREGEFDPDWFMKRILPEFNFPDRPAYVPAGLTAQQLLSIHRKAYLKYYFRPKIVARRLLACARSFDELAATVKGGLTLIGNLVSRG